MADVTAVICAIVSEVLRLPEPIDPGVHASEIEGWSSHATVEIIFAVEERFGFEMTSAEMESIEGPAALIAVVTRHMAPQAAA